LLILYRVFFLGGKFHLLVFLPLVHLLMT
jgi:hypothetical protein